MKQWMVLFVALACANDAGPLPEHEAVPSQAVALIRLYGTHQNLTYWGWPDRRTTGVQKAKALNARVSRNALDWYEIEKTEGAPDWSRPDAVVAELRAAGITPLFFLLSSPPWANGRAGTGFDDRLYVPQGEPAFTAWVNRYTTFARQAAARYKGKVRWELWNEQNEVYFWKPAPNIDQYARWYRSVYAAIKCADPNAQVALGGLTGLFAGCCITGDKFLQGLYDRGVRPDIVAIHPYSGSQQAPDVHLAWQQNFDDIAGIRALMVRNGEGGKPIWVTEWGWTSPPLSQTTQARYVAKSLRMIDTQYPYVTLATYFIDIDVGGYTQGLFTQSFAKKQAADSFAAFAASR